uniref:Uncharacterized protein n=1 Tax=Campylobacter jejuni subsp. jejuni serotype O:23/36 (strain 81-176) TaxID=354242 RepID=Q0Q7G4_CAMJJ|nr:hypothetical protein cju27 [Campylobacter jejuni subsp. jejuni 81-176]
MSRLIEYPLLLQGLEQSLWLTPNKLLTKLLSFLIIYFLF